MQLGRDVSIKYHTLNRIEIAASLHLRQKWHWRARQKKRIVVFLIFIDDKKFKVNKKYMDLRYVWFKIPKFIYYKKALVSQ